MPATPEFGHSDPAQPRSGAEWAVIIPVKPAASGKSRLAGAAGDRSALARAIALDTIEAAGEIAAVFVVTDDPEVGAAARELGAAIVAEGEARGLNAAIAVGVDAASRSMGDGVHRAALLGDLPALRPADLADALRQAASIDRGVVADAEGTGSTLVTARAGVRWLSAFGEGSFERHLALGCRALEMPDASTLRRDVDTPAQLVSALALGLGPRTAALLA